MTRSQVQRMIEEDNRKREREALRVARLDAIWTASGGNFERYQELLHEDNTTRWAAVMDIFRSSRS